MFAEVRARLPGLNSIGLLYLQLLSAPRPVPLRLLKRRPDLPDRRHVDLLAGPGVRVVAVVECLFHA